MDSSAYLALLDQDDEHYKTATRIFSSASQEGFRFMTTNFVVAEAHALVLSFLGPRKGREFLQSAAQGTIRIYRIEEEDEEQARAVVLRYEDKDFSLVDCLSFAAMEKYSIPYAFAFDKHFKQYGIEILE